MNDMVRGFDIMNRETKVEAGAVPCEAVPEGSAGRRQRGSWRPASRPDADRRRGRGKWPGIVALPQVHPDALRSAPAGATLGGQDALRRHRFLLFRHDRLRRLADLPSMLGGDLDRAAEALGMEAVKGVYLAVEAEYREQMGDREWDIYKHGTQEERQRFRAEMRASGESAARQA